MAGAIQISRQHLHKLASKAGHFQKKYDRVSKKAEHAFDIGIDAALTVGTTAGLGFLHGRHGTVELGGVPLELAVGVGGTAAALFGFGGKHADRIGAVGAAMLGVYGYNTAKGAGLKMKKAAGGTETTTKGRLPQDSLRPEEVATMDRPTVAERTMG